MCSTFSFQKVGYPIFLSTTICGELQENCHYLNIFVNIIHHHSIKKQLKSSEIQQIKAQSLGHIIMQIGKARHENGRSIFMICSNIFI